MSDKQALPPEPPANEAAKHSRAEKRKKSRKKLQNSPYFLQVNPRKRFPITQSILGIVIGGTSAGAAMMPDMMIIEGDSETNPRVDVVAMGPGMGFLPGVVIDQHFAQRGRLGRLVSALLLQPAVLGFGIDENTAIVVTGDEFEVIGESAVTVIDESEKTHDNLDGLLKDEGLAICGVKLHILPHGYRFNLKTRQPVLHTQTVRSEKEKVTA